MLVHLTLLPPQFIVHKYPQTHHIGSAPRKFFRGSIDARMHVRIDHGFGWKTFVQPPPSSCSSMLVFKFIQITQQQNVLFGDFLFGPTSGAVFDQLIPIGIVHPRSKILQPLNTRKHANNFSCIDNTYKK